ncbi:MAG: glycosyltransferase family 4 protein [Verrucomicrobiota bacterium]
MKHYSESLVKALAPAAPLFFIRNYRVEEPGEGMLADLTLNPLRPGNYRELWRIAKKLLQLRPAAIHLNSESPPLLPLFPLLAFHNSAITLHDARPHAGERLSKRLFHWVHLGLVFLFIRKIIVHSEKIRAQLPALFRLKKVRVLPHINYRHWAAEERSSTAPPPPFVVLFFGRLLQYKGVEFLVEAFRELDPERFHLIIAGEGEMPSGAARANTTLYPGFISDEQMSALFQRAHAVALPYLAASQSGVAYMAFAFGKPVIATRVGALPDVIREEENGLLIEPRSAPALKEAIERLAQSPLYERLAEGIQKQNLSSDEAIRHALLAIYAE